MAYSLVKTEGVAVLMAEASDNRGYIFKHNIGVSVDGVDQWQAVQLQEVAGRAWATVSGAIRVFKRPHQATLHYASMQATRAVQARNALITSVGRGDLVADITDDYLVDNMSEYIETLE